MKVKGTGMQILHAYARVFPHIQCLGLAEEGIIALLVCAEETQGPEFFASLFGVESGFLIRFSSVHRELRICPASLIIQGSGFRTGYWGQGFTPQSFSSKVSSG